MRFKDQHVWVHLDDGGRPVTDAEGRAEMKYRQDDPRVYRPSARNLVAADESAPAPGADAPRPPRRIATVKPKPGAAVMREEKGAPIDIWTDGACTGNPGPMGIGVVVISGGERRKEHGEYLGQGTNNIAELVAIERGVDLTEMLFGAPPPPVRIYTDSQYCIGVLSLGWKAKANQELVGRLRDRLAALPSFRMIKVAGHAGIPENERCDELARGAITSTRLR